jgi:hypothetical protein
MEQKSANNQTNSKNLSKSVDDLNNNSNSDDDISEKNVMKQV